LFIRIEDDLMNNIEQHELPEGVKLSTKRNVADDVIDDPVLAVKSRFEEPSLSA